MKKLFSIFLLLCTAFAYAESQPIFEEADDQECCFRRMMPFSIEESDSEQEEVPSTSSKCTDGCECDDCKGLKVVEASPEISNDSHDFSLSTSCIEQIPIYGTNKMQASCMRWGRYKVNFFDVNDCCGVEEKIFLRFPSAPIVSQSSTLLHAYAYDGVVMYSFNGYYPPVRNVDPIAWFDQVLYTLSLYPYSLVSHTIQQLPCGDWILDYVTHDYVQNHVIKGRSIVTPFNAYTLQCVKPNGRRDHFNYFLDNFWIKCNCS